jgi:hypothetical protein
MRIISSTSHRWSQRECPKARPVTVAGKAHLHSIKVVAVNLVPSPLNIKHSFRVRRLALRLAFFGAHRERSRAGWDARVPRLWP